MNIHKIWKQSVTLLTTVALAACSGGGPSMSATSSGSASASENQAGSRGRNAEVSNAARATIHRDAASLVAETFRVERWSGWSSFDSFVASSINNVGLMPTDVMREMLPALDLQKMSDNLPPNSAYARLSQEAAAAKAAGDIEHATACLRAMWVPVLLGTASYPLRGWPVRRRQDPDLALQFMQNAEHIADVASRVGAMLALRLRAGPSLADPQAAMVGLNDALADIPCEKLALIVDQYQPSSSGYSVDGTGSAKGAGWSSANGYFDWSPTGITWTKNGATWFGDGYLQGVQIKLALDRAQSLRQTVSTQAGQETGTRATQDTQSGISAKPPGG